MSKLSGKTILITGANGGFGREFTEQLLEEGARLILTSRNEAALRSFAEEAKRRYATGAVIAVIGADISTTDGCRELYAKTKAVVPEIDILINNAGLLTYGYFHETPVDAWRKVLQLNLFSTMELTALLLPDMIVRKQGQIVFLSSTAGFIPSSYQTAYSVSKFGVRGFAMALADEVTPFGVDITVIYPFWSDTDMLKSPAFGTKRPKKLSPHMVVSPEKIVRTAIRGIKRQKRHVYPDVFAKLFWWINKVYPMVGRQPMEPAVGGTAADGAGGRRDGSGRQGMIKEKRGKKVLVTGAAGFIGSFLCTRLLKEDYDVTALDISDKNAQAMRDMGMAVVIGDLTRPESIQGVCDGMDIVIHLAAHVKGWGSKRLFYDSIYHATQNLLVEAVKNRCRFIYFSSFCAAGVGGVAGHMIGHKEDDPERKTGNSYYGDAKYDTEKLVMAHHDRNQIIATIIRPANVIGPGSVWITDTIEALQKKGAYPLIDNGQYNACFVYVDNLVDGILLAMTKEIAQGRTYHFRDDYDVTWKGYATDLGVILGKTVTFSNIPFKIAWTVGYVADRLLRPLNLQIAIGRHTVGMVGRDNRVDTCRAQKELGWKTHVSYEAAMGAIGDWVKRMYPKPRV